MKSLVYSLPRKDTGLTATEDMIVAVEIVRKTTEEQVICKQGEPIKYFYLPTGKYTEPLLVRSKQLVVAKYPELFREPEGDDAWDASAKTDQYSCHHKAPWFHRRVCLDCIFRQCMAKMKSYPLLRLKEIEKKRIPHPTYSLERPLKRAAAEMLFLPSKKQRKSSKNAQAALPKDRYVEVYDATGTEQNIHQIKLTALVANQTPATPTTPGKEKLDVKKLSLNTL